MPRFDKKTEASLELARRDYKFRLPESDADRCFDCVHVKHPRREACALLDIVIHDARRSRSPLHAATMATMRLQ